MYTSEVTRQTRPELVVTIDDDQRAVGAVVRHFGTFGRPAFLEINGGDRHTSKQEIRKLLKGGAA